MARTTVDELLAAARSRLDRVDPDQAAAAIQASDAVLIDIRSESQIAQDGVIPGALVIGRNVLEWRLDPTSSHTHPQAPEFDQQVIVFCDAGYASSFAAVSLQALGFARATDLDGGFKAWRDAGLPVHAPAPQ